MLLMPMLYLPPLSYMALLHAAGEACIEAQENYVKSSYRNRCEVIGSNGIISLSIPLAGGRDHHRLYRDACIAYDSDWQHRHYMSILSCYGSAPFFEHYIPYLQPFYERQYETLFEYNKQLLELMIGVMKLNVTLTYTDMYEKKPHDKTDLRKAFGLVDTPVEIIIGDKKYMTREMPYMRVFGDESPSVSISCLDLLFNEGPLSKKILEHMIVRV